MNESHFGVGLFNEQWHWFPITRKICPLPQQRLKKTLPPPIIAIISDTGKSIMRSHANRILKNPMAK